MPRFSGLVTVKVGSCPGGDKNSPHPRPLRKLGLHTTTIFVTGTHNTDAPVDPDKHIHRARDDAVPPARQHVGADVPHPHPRALRSTQALDIVDWRNDWRKRNDPGA